MGCGPHVGVDPVADGGSGPTEGSSGGSEHADGVSDSTGGGGTEDSFATSTTGSAAESSSSDDSTSSGPLDPSSTGAFELDCEARCAEPVDGSCVGDLQTCTTTCAETVGGHGEAVADAFETCVASQPLCFSLLEDCMWSALFGGEAVEQTYVLQGTAFDAWEGLPVASVLSADRVTVDGSSATIQDGAFSVEATHTGTFDEFWNPRTFYLFVDVDEDGACTPGVDHVQSWWMQSLGADFSEPTFVLEATAAAASQDALCAQF